MTAFESAEAAMLICFSISWYWSIAQMIRVRAAVGKSPAFVTLICIGYLFGIAAKIWSAEATGTLSPIIWLYAWNLLVTLTDLASVLHFRRAPRGV